MHLLALIAAIGIGSIIAAIVGWWSAKAVAISNHRQNWINALRDDLVTFLKEVDVLHYRVAMLSGNRSDKPTIDDLEKQQDARNAAMLVYRRILMRLNMTESDHTALGQALRGLMLITNTTADSAKMAAVVDLSRRVLKAEWAVTKFGLFNRPMLWARARQRKVTLGRGPGIEMEVGESHPAEFGPQLSATLVPAADDPPRSNPETQAEFWNITHALQARGLKVSSRVFVQDTVDGGMSNLGQLTIDLARDFAPAVTAVLGAWAQARFGRKVRLKIGDTEAEARTPEEIEKLLALAAQHRPDNLK